MNSSNYYHISKIINKYHISLITNHESPSEIISHINLTHQIIS